MHTNLSAYDLSLIAAGLAYEHNGRLIPVLRGGDPAGDPIFPTAPADFTPESIGDDELQTFIDASATAAESVAAAPASFVTDERTTDVLLAEMTAGVEALEAARAELAARKADDDAEPEAEPVEDAEPSEELSAELEALAARATAPAVEPPASVEPPAEPEVVEPEVVVAAAPPAAPARPPARSRSAAPAPVEPEVIAMTAALEGMGPAIGTEVDELAIARMMQKRRGMFGNIPPGTSGEKIGIAVSNWRDRYPAERVLTGKTEDIVMELVAAATNQATIKAEMRRRRDAEPGSLVASGGLCAPVTPYYNLQMISQAMRPVRAALPSFSADRGGIRFAAPASLAAITTGVGLRTAANDFAGGTEGAKTCQRISCPGFSEVDVDIIFHCIEFGNLGGRTFPELLAQWNNLVLAAHARLAESNLLTGIDAASTAVTAQDIGFGATGALLGQILAAANGMRSRHRMDPEAILRLMIPDWTLDLLISDVIRGQFQRFDTDEAKITALLRSFDIEPSFYIDGANGAGQVFGTQSAGVLNAFPSTVRWYLYPEGSFLYLDGGTLELGLVRDSVLNATNDFQIFGESFENVAFVGVESLAVTSTICDSGTVSAPAAITHCGDYTQTT